LSTDILIPTDVTLVAMSVLLETSLGDLVIDLLVDSSPKACEKSVHTHFTVQLSAIELLSLTMT
jgi:hypothetical protein